MCVKSRRKRGSSIEHKGRSTEHVDVAKTNRCEAIDCNVNRARPLRTSSE